MRIVIGRFRTSLWALALTILGAALFVRLGFWQLHRAQEKRELFTRYELRQQGPPLTAIPVDGDEAAVLYSPVELHGRFDASHQIILDNMSHSGKVGYEILTPFLSDESGWVMVNRGWVPAPPDRRQLPKIPVDEAPRELRGQLDHLPQAGLRLANPPAPAATWPRRMSFPTMAELSDALDRKLARYQVLMSPDQPGGYLREWRPQVPGPQMHLSYAVQWFAFAVAAVAILVIIGIKRPSEP